MHLRVEHHTTVTSTMDLAIAAAERGAAEGLVIVADEQTRGRGRRGRPWSSPAQAGLYISFLLRPPVDAPASPALTLITLAAGVAVRHAIRQATAVVPELKWPNDLMVGRRKLAGILAEGLGIGSPTQAVILGVGVNVGNASHPDEVADRATSVEAERGRPANRVLLLDGIIHAIDETYESLRDGKADDILRAWREAAPSANGAEVEWESASGCCRGTTAGIDTAGALLVQTDHGIEQILGGELRWF